MPQSPNEQESIDRALAGNFGAIKPVTGSVVTRPAVAGVLVGSDVVSRDQTLIDMLKLSWLKEWDDGRVRIDNDGDVGFFAG